ncbi:MAG: hypothetical protein ACRDMJ_05840 [Solirubrobacteraceae bacterium]
MMALEAGGSRTRSTLVAGMCAAMTAIYGLALAIPTARSFFALAVPAPAIIATGMLAAAVAIGALWLCGFSLHVGSPEREAAAR